MKSCPGCGATHPPMPLKAVLEEFVEDIEAVGLDQLREEWPDLEVTYIHAKEALKNME